jgi:8-oxo-dGTP diphosphatase
MKTIPVIAWVLLQNRQILVARSKGKSAFYIPGGKIEPGENSEQALIREINEELNVQLIKSTIFSAQTFQNQAHGQSKNILVNIQYFFAEYEGNLQASSEIEELAWFRYADRTHVSHADQMMFDWLISQDLLD